MADLSINPIKELSSLFTDAKKKDEFEFCCTILRVRGLEGTDSDTFIESNILSHQIVKLIEAPIDTLLKYRLLFFLYCHLTETRDFYNIVANMIRVTLGERYTTDPFKFMEKVEINKQHGYPRNSEIDQLINLANQANYKSIANLFDMFYLRPVRNAFYHSDYVLTEKHFNIRLGEGLIVGDVVTRTRDLEWLIPRIELGINSALATMQLLIENIQSYKEDKIVSGRFGQNSQYIKIQHIKIQLTTEQGYGLTGFKTHPDPDLKQ